MNSSVTLFDDCFDPSSRKRRLNRVPSASSSSEGETTFDQEKSKKHKQMHSSKDLKQSLDKENLLNRSKVTKKPMVQTVSPALDTMVLTKAQQHQIIVTCSQTLAKQQLFINIDYMEEIYEYKFKIETQYIIRPLACLRETYSLSHHYLFEKLFHCFHMLNLHMRTLFRAMNIFDRYLAKLGEDFEVMEIFQIGAACLLLATKIEENEILDDEALALINSRSTAQENIKQEMKILQLLDFTLHNPTRYEFLVYYAKMLQLTTKQEKFIIYLLTLTLSNYEFNYYPESAIAAAVVHYTLQLTSRFTKQTWNTQFIAITTYQERDLVKILLDLHRKHYTAHKSRYLNEIVTFFTKHEFMKVAACDALNLNDCQFSDNQCYELFHQEKLKFIEKCKPNQ